MLPSSLSQTPKATQGAPVAQAREEKELIVQDFLNVLVKHKWLLLGSFVVAILLGALYTASQAPQYQTKSVLYVGRQQASPQLADLFAGGATNRDVLNEVEILKSHTLAANVAARLMQMKRVPGSNRPLTVLDPGDTGRAVALRDVAERLRGAYIAVQPVNRDVNMVDLVATSSDPEEAVVIADLYAEEYLALNRSEARARFRTAREYLSSLTSQVDSTLRGTETSIVNYQNAEGVVDPEVEADQLVRQLAELEMRRGELAAQAAGARAELGGYEQQVRRIAPRIAEQATQIDDRVLPELQGQRAQAESELETLYNRYPEERTAATPAREIVALRRRIAQLDEEIQERSATYVRRQTSEPLAAGTGGANALQDAARQSLLKRAQIEQFSAAEGIIQQQIAETRSRLSRLPTQAAFLGRLNLSTATQADIYQQALGRYQEALIAEQSELGNAAIVDRALTPGAPVRPRPAMNLLVAALGGLLFGAGLALLRETVDNRLRRPDDLRKRGYPVIGVVPNMQRSIEKDFDGRQRITVDGRSYDTRLATLLTPMSPVAEAYRRLRTAVQFSRPDRQPQVIAVTSPGPGEGKSVTSMNIAVAMAQAGRRTLYIDADLRRPAGHKLMGLPREPGLVDLLFDELGSDIEQFRTDADDLYVIPAGRSAPNPAELIGSRKMRALLEQMRTEFDTIIVDTPPILAVTDAVILATSVDVVVLVASANATTWHAAVRSAEQLREVNADLLGFVLNRFDVESAYGGYGYGYTYGYGYSDRYGEDPATTAKSTSLPS